MHRTKHRNARPQQTDTFNSTQNGVFFSTPFMAPLLFPNVSSDARDHCANERTFLSYLRLSIYMSVVSLAIMLSFHVRSQPSELELKMAKPLGIVFWILGVVCLAAGGGNYVKTIEKYGKRRAIVQTGWKTQIVSRSAEECTQSLIVPRCLALLRQVS